MNLGSLIDLLKIQPSGAKVVISSPVMLYPGRVMSYRGRYADLAIEPETNDTEMTAEVFVDRLEKTVGQYFTGYKGGEFEMHRGVEVWIAEYSMSSPWSSRVTGVTNLWDSYVRLDWVKDDS